MAGPPTLTAILKFALPTDDKPVYFASVGGEEARLDLEGRFAEHRVEVEDGRAGGDFDLDREGFQLVRHASAVSDFYDDAQVEGIYEAEVRDLVAAATGAVRVVVFDHTRRADSVAQRAALKVREPSAVVHNDYTDTSAPKRVRDLLPADEAEDLLSRRFAIVNVWRALGHPAETSMLALCDARSAAPESLIVTERRAKDRIGEILMAAYDPAQRWVCFPAMRLDEALLLKTYDSATDGRARFAIHTAFDNPNPPSAAKPRESMETRCFAFF